MRAAMEGTATRESREVSDAELPFEFMLNALRLAEGFPVALFAERTGLPATVVEPQLAQAEASGLIERDHARIAPTAKGRRFLNDLLERFLVPAGRGGPARVINISSAGTARP
jgi:oxygen-independent coproporphyrinogen-3 oxidase